MELLIWAAVINWGAPLLLWVYPLVMWLYFKDFTFDGWYGPFARFKLIGELKLGQRVYYKRAVRMVIRVDGDWVYLSDAAGLSGTPRPMAEIDPVEPWHIRLWRDWAGIGLYWFMCYKDRVSPRTIVHEGTHCWQFAILGLLQLLLYWAHTAWILVFQKRKHPYLDCWAERMARRRAGQQVDFTPSEWPQGRDRWPWW